MRGILSAALLTLSVSCTLSESQEELTGVASVIDGDTLDIRGERIRLHGIDAPESGQQCQDAKGQPWRCGQQAALALADRIGRLPVTCEGSETDNYGRLIAVCFQDGEDLNGWMVEQGWAVAYRQYSQDYVSSEEAAKASGSGIWAGEFVMPWDWRRGARITDSSDAEPRKDGCTIKGNINSEGEKIYHLPGGRWYDRTRIDESNGERWFCSGTEARAAGWRKSGG